MKDILSKVFIFAAGAAIGSVVTWKLVEEKYKRITQEEIDSVKETFAKRDEITMDNEEPDENIQETNDPDEEYVEEDIPKRPIIPEKPDIMEFAKKIRENGYRTDYTNTAMPDVKTEDEERKELGLPYVIAPTEFGEFEGYDQETLYYYADHKLADEDGILFTKDDIEEKIGLGFEDHFGEYEEDSVYIRNEDRCCDYEILMSMKTYEEDVIHPQYREE